MKRIFIVFSCTIVFMALAFLPEAKADSAIYPESVLISEGQTIDDNFVRAANTFDIRGVIKGDVIVAGSSVNISGKVEGDVLVVSGTLKISGEVEGNLRAAGGTLSVDGTIGKNVNVFFGEVEFSTNSEVGGSLAVWAGTVNLKGIVSGKVDGGAGQVTLSGTIMKDVNLRFDAEEENSEKVNLTVLPSTVIGGNLVYNSYTEADIKEGAEISGQVMRKKPVGIFKEAGNFISSFWWFTRIAGLFGLFVIGSIIVVLFKKDSKRITEIMVTKSGRSILWGILILIVVPIVSFLLLFTVIGIPLAVIMLLLYGIAVYISTVFIGLTIGWKILDYFKNRTAKNPKNKKEPSLFWSMILGILLFSLVTDFLLGFGWGGKAVFLGFLSGLIKFFCLLWALGAMFLTKREYFSTSPGENVKNK